MSENVPKRTRRFSDILLGPQGLDDRSLEFPDRREFASDADRQRAIEAHRKRIQRELRRRRG